MKVLVVLGTRPEAIKLAPVIRELTLRREQKQIITSVCVTGQHREMLDQVLDLFQMKPDHDLNLMTEGQTPTQVASLTLARLEPIILREAPDWVVVQGDTTSALAAALTAFYSGARVAHVEAGLRTRNKLQPFPEEINRTVTGVISDMHFAPTNVAKRNLISEGVPSGTIFVTGNSVIDALRLISSRPQPAEVGSLLESMGVSSPEGPKLILVTAHRRENIGEPLEKICAAIKHLCESYPDDLRMILPLHPNPKIKEPMKFMLRGVANVQFVRPLKYDSLIHVMKSCFLVLTDSGGLQEEAPALGKPVLVMRNTTERPEGIEAGLAKLVGTETNTIIEATERLLSDKVEYNRMKNAKNVYGDGLASKRIVAGLLNEEFDEFLPTG